MGILYSLFPSLDYDHGNHEAMVFKPQTESTSLHAYVLKTGEIYNVTERYALDRSISFYCAATYPEPVAINVGRHANEGTVQLTLNGAPLARYRQVLTHPVVFLDNFLYRFSDGELSRIGQSGLEWTQRSTLPFDKEPISVAVFNNNIIFLCDVQNGDEVAEQCIEVYSFSPSTFNTKKVGRLENATSAVLFYYAGYLLVLTGSGNYMYITKNLKLEPWYYRTWVDLLRPKTPVNWGTELPVTGAVIHQGYLLVFCTQLPHDQTLPENAEFYKGIIVKFLQIPSDGQCQRVKLPQSWLIMAI